MYLCDSLDHQVPCTVWHYTDRLQFEISLASAHQLSLMHAMLYHNLFCFHYQNQCTCTCGWNIAHNIHVHIIQQINTIITFLLILTCPKLLLISSLYNCAKVAKLVFTEWSSYRFWSDTELNDAGTLHQVLTHINVVMHKIKYKLHVYSD